LCLIYNNKNILKNKEEMTRADCFLSLSGAILNFVAMSEKSGNHPDPKGAAPWPGV
jgi:hypothetical protein